MHCKIVSSYHTQPFANVMYSASKNKYFGNKQYFLEINEAYTIHNCMKSVAVWIMWRCHVFSIIGSYELPHGILGTKDATTQTFRAALTHRYMETSIVSRLYAHCVNCLHISIIYFTCYSHMMHVCSTVGLTIKSLHTCTSYMSVCFTW